MKRLPISLMILFLVPMLMGCHCSRKATKSVTMEQKMIRPVVSATASALVYKTRKDYSRYVPVILNDEKTKIVSYPDPSDIYYQGKLSYPTPLDNGFLLDNRGIGPNVAFLKLTYEAYSQLKGSLTMQQMMDSLLDKTPLLELWNCGPRDHFKDEVNDLNALIKKGFPDCDKLVKGPVFIMHE